MTLADPHRDAHRRHAGLEAPAPAARSARHPAHHAGAARAAARLGRRAVSVRLAQARDPRRAAFAGDVEARRSAVARARAAVHDRAAAYDRRPLGDRRRAGRPAPLSGAADRRRPARRPRARRSGCGARHHHARHRRAAALGRPHRAPRARRNLRADQAPQDDADLRQHAQPGRDDLPAAVGDERRQSGDRAASRLARCRPAAQGRGRDGGRTAARGGRDLVARSRHRLGRRRSGDQCGRAEGRLAAAAAHRPRQSPHGRAVARRAGAGQSLRGAGMPRRDRRGGGECAGHAALAHRRARRAGAARARLRLRRAVLRRRSLSRR